MSSKVMFVCCSLIASSFFQDDAKTFYIVTKGIYVHWEKKDKRIKVPYKESEWFYFSLKNDSVALIQEVFKGKAKKIKEYKIAQNPDTVYQKRYSILNGKSVVKIRRIYFQKIYQM